MRMRNKCGGLTKAKTALWLFAIQIILGKDGMTMMAMFFAQRVILGKTAYKDVPAKLKDQVKELLVDAGLPELVEE